MGYRDYFGQSAGTDPYEGVGTSVSQWEPADLARRVTLVGNHLKSVRRVPKLAVALAQTPVPDDQLIHAIRQSEVWNAARYQRTQLLSLPAERQREKWDRMDRPQRALLRQVGYRTPEEIDAAGDQGPGGIGGFLAGVYHGLMAGEKGSIPGGGADAQAELERSRRFLANSPARPVMGLQEEMDRYNASQQRGIANVVRAPGKIEDLGIPGVSQVAGAAENALGGTLDVAGRAVAATPIGQGLQMMNTAGSVVSHAYRFSAEYYERSADPQFSDSWDQIHDIWEETGAHNGEGYWRDDTHKRVAALMPGDERAQSWAKSLAAGDTIADITARQFKPGTPEYQRKYLNIATRAGDADFKKALRTLEMDKVSPGRDLARAFGFSYGSKPYTITSGSTDLINTLYLDPLLIAGKVTKGVRALRYGIALEDAASLITARKAEQTLKAMELFKGAEGGWEAGLEAASPMFLIRHGLGETAFANEVAKAFKAGNMAMADGKLPSELAKLTQQIPGTKRAMDALRSYDAELRGYRIGERQKELGTVLSAAERDQVPGIEHASDVWNFMDSGAGHQALIHGSYGGFTKSYVDLPRLTTKGMAFRPIKAASEAVIDFGRFGRQDIVELADDAVQTVRGQAPIMVKDAIEEAVDNRLRAIHAQYHALPEAEKSTYIATMSPTDKRLFYENDLFDPTFQPDIVPADIAAPAPGTTRLYRVTNGNVPLNQADLPAHMDPYIANNAGIVNWWSDDLAHARAMVDNIGPTAQLHYVDAAKGTFTRIPDSFAAVPGREFHILDDATLSDVETLGRVGSWVDVAKGGKLVAAARLPLALPSNLIYGMTHRVPENTTLRLFGEDFVPDSQRLLDVAFSSPVKQRWMEEFLRTASPAHRREIMRASMDHMFLQNGVYTGGADAIEYAQRYLNGTMQMYARDGLDLQFHGGNPVRVGIGAIADHADGIMIPSFREMLAQSRRVSVTRRLFGGINNQYIDAFMGSYWKPSVLLRLGFIPRAAGEELLGTVLRFPTILQDHWVWRPLALKEGEPLWLAKQTAALARHANHFIPEPTADMVENFAQFLESRASGWIRGMAARQVDTHTLRALRVAANSPAIQASQAEIMPKVTGASIRESMLPQPGDYDTVVMELAAPGKPARVAQTRRGVSQWRDVLKGDPDFQGYFANRIRHYVGEDIPFIETARASGIYVHPEQAQKVVNAYDAVRSGDRAAEVAAAYEGMGTPVIEDTIGELRYAINSNPKLRNALWRNDGLRKGPDPDQVGNAVHALNDARRAAKTPAERFVTEIWDQLDMDTRDMLLVDEGAVARHLGIHTEDQQMTMSRAVGALDPPEEGLHRVFVAAPIPPQAMSPDMWDASQIAWHDNPVDALQFGFDNTPAAAGYHLYYTDMNEQMYELRRLHEEEQALLPETQDVTTTEFGELAKRGHLTADEELTLSLKEVPGFSVPSDYSEFEGETFKTLMDKARAGDQDAAFQLMQASADRALQNLQRDPSAARFFRESERSLRDNAGRHAPNPIAEGMARRYVILANEDGYKATAALDPMKAKGVLAERVDEGAHALTAGDADTYGLSKYQPISRWSTYSRDDADNMLRVIAGDHPGNFTVGYVDVPEARLKVIDQTGVSDPELASWGMAEEASTTGYKDDLSQTIIRPGVTTGPGGVPLPYRTRDEYVDWLVRNEHVEKWQDAEAMATKAEADFQEGVAGPPPWALGDQEMTRRDSLYADYLQYRTGLDEAELAYARMGVDDTPGMSPNEIAFDHHNDTADLARERLAAEGYDMNKPDDVARLKDDLAGRKTIDRTSENRREWAGTYAGLVKQLSSSPVDGRYLHSVGPRAVRQGSFDLNDVAFNGVLPEHMPMGVPAPEVFVHDPSLPTRLVERGFSVINKAIGATARTPLYMENYLRRYPLAEELVRSTMEDPDAAAAMLELASRTQGRQRDVLDTYHWVYQQLVRRDPRFGRYASWADAEMEASLAEALPDVKVVGMKPAMVEDVKRHFASMTGDEVAVLKRWSHNLSEIQRVAHDGAAAGAIADTIPFIDDHKVRSQFQEYVRNVTPFHFAEEQMLKRWARVLVHSPEALRRAQLTYLGVKHAGIIHQNEYGDDVWTMPGSTELSKILAKVSRPVFGGDNMIPVAVPFTGSVKYTLPGLNRVGVPSFSPVATVPMTLLGRRFPEIQSTNRDVLGQSADRDLVDQLLPVSLTRVYDTFFSRPDTSAQYTSAMIQAMQYMEANGLSPEPPGPNAGIQAQDRYKDELDHYIDRVERWTRVMLGTRAILGFLSPAPPQIEMPKNLNPELQTLLRNVPYEDAIATFMKEHPDATAYTVFGSEAESGAAMRTTPEVGKYLDDNEAFINRHKMAAPWLLPQNGSDNGTARSVYAKQVKMGLRERKSPREWLDDYAFAVASPEYFDSRDSYEQTRIAVAGDKAKRDRLDAAWKDWKDTFMQMHPLFEARIQSRDAHDRRIEVLQSTRAALADPDLPPADHHQYLRTMVDSYDSFASTLDDLTGNRTAVATQKRKNLRIAFANWGTLFIRRHPEVAAYWHRNIEPEIGLSFADELALEDQG